MSKEIIFKFVGERNSGGLIIIHNIIRYEGSRFLFKSLKVNTLKCLKKCRLGVWLHLNMILFKIPTSSTDISF